MEIKKMAEQIADAVLDFDPYCGCDKYELTDSYEIMLSDNPRGCADDLRNIAEGYNYSREGQNLLRLADMIDFEYNIDRFAITEDDKRLMLIITHELLQLKQRDLLQMYGSRTIDEIHALHSKLEHEDFCKRHGIARWEDMTADDYEREYCEKWEA